MPPGRFCTILLQGWRDNVTTPDAPGATTKGFRAKNFLRCQPLALCRTELPHPRTLREMTSRPLATAAPTVQPTNGGSRGLAEALAAIREVTRKVAACEAAMEGKGPYLGLTDPVSVLVENSRL